MVIEQGKTPVVWPLVDERTIHHDEMFWYVFAANFTFDAFGFYYLVNWREQIEKTEKRDNKKKTK
jgi:hypothetical protein